MKTNSSADQWILGAVTGVSATSVSIDHQEYSLEEMRRLEISKGERSHTLTGLGLGAVGGAALGFGVGAAFFGGYHGDLEQVRYPLAGFVGGLAMGGLVGAYTRTERWRPLPADRIRVSVFPGRSNRIVLGVGVQF